MTLRVPMMRKSSKQTNLTIPKVAGVLNQTSFLEVQKNATFSRTIKVALICLDAKSVNQKRALFEFLVVVTLIARRTTHNT